MTDSVVSKIRNKRTFIERYLSYIKLLDETEDKKVIDEIQSNLDEMKDYQVNILEAIKRGSSEAFDELIQVKDIRNFIYHYAWHIRKYFRFNYSEEDVVNEIVYQIFYTVKKNYRIYYEPNEFSLLINSMRRWIKQKVSLELNKMYCPKQDGNLSNIFIEDESYDGTEFLVNDVLDKVLTDEERVIFDLKFYDEFNYKQIGERVGRSKDSVQRQYENSFKKITNYMEVTNKW